MNKIRFLWKLSLQDDEQDGKPGGMQKDWQELK